jgi:hypothetical protein
MIANMNQTVRPFNSIENHKQFPGYSYENSKQMEKQKETVCKKLKSE